MTCEQDILLRKEKVPYYRQPKLTCSKQFHSIFSSVVWFRESMRMRIGQCNEYLWDKPDWSFRLTCFGNI